MVPLRSALMASGAVTVFVGGVAFVAFVAFDAVVVLDAVVPVDFAVGAAVCATAGAAQTQSAATAPMMIPRRIRVTTTVPSLVTSFGNSIRSTGGSPPPEGIAPTVDVTFEDFQELVRQVLDAVPAPFDELLQRVPVIVLADSPEHEPTLLGRYHGVPLPERSHGEPTLPSTIEIYWRPLCHHARTETELRDEVRITVLHELGHHLGMDEDDLDRLGYA
jgi:predicted Zn-dependent protease with MMP-like domain